LIQKFQESSTQRSLLTGIILHHIPVAVALMSMLMQSGVKKLTAISFLLIFAAMAPAGALSSYLISTGDIENLPRFFNQMMAVVIGIFLHISTTILFETYEQHRFNYLKLLIILLGGLLAFLS